jgi:hypothetical protein
VKYFKALESEIVETALATLPEPAAAPPVAPAVAPAEAPPQEDIVMEEAPKGRDSQATTQSIAEGTGYTSEGEMSDGSMPLTGSKASSQDVSAATSDAEESPTARETPAKKQKIAASETPRGGRKKKGLRKTRRKQRK